MPPRRVALGVRLTAPRRATSIAGMPRDVRLACGAGVGVGAVAAATAYVSWACWGPTPFGVAAIPLSLLVVGALYVLLVRRRKPRASNWLALGYTGAILLVTVVLVAEEALRGLYQELYVTAW
jgi:hypothetical protein